MQSDLDNELNAIVNASGFAFQLAVEDHIRHSKTGWNPILREHPWRTESGENRFIDIILEQVRGNFRAIVECKRTKQAKWVFLVPKTASTENRSCCLWADGRDGETIYSRWDDVRIGPASYEADFCAVRGKGEGQVPMLERIASDVLCSIDAVADEEIRLVSDRDRQWFMRLFIPIIITNAKLYACRFTSPDVALDTGDLRNEVYEEIQFIRFRKTLGIPHREHAKRPNDISEANQNDQRSIFVANADAIVKLLSGLDLDSLQKYRGGSWPWEEVRRMNKAALR